MRPVTIDAAYIERRSMPEPNSGCWLWLGMVSVYGYGRIEAAGQKVFAHRASFEAHKGPVPTGLHVCHKCDVPSCVNPDHLWAGTNLENIADRDRKGRHARVCGEQNNNAKLSAEAILSIRSDTRLLREIAEEFGISIQHVSRIRLRQNWEHLRRERASA